jgi:hypothetical protein
MDQIQKEAFHEQIRNVLGAIMADRFYAAIDIEAYVDSFDEELFRDTAAACARFMMRRESRERRAEKCL